MSLSPMKPAVRALRRPANAAAAALIGLQTHMHTVAIAASGPFDTFAGSWSGSGTLKLTSGESERLRCRVSYDVGSNGQKMQQELRCASDSYNFNVSSEISYNADARRVSGTWSETNYGNSGFLSGTVNGGQLQATVQGRNFSAAIAVSTRGNEQSVTIRPQGSEVSEVSVALRKSG